MSNRSPLRCAIYTRVSTDHGLEQEFNSLDAQREASEAYIKSQAHEGWRLLPDQYNDGGYSGGSLDRPAVQNLLAAVRERRIDIIVVYKVDRLTRSLADFARLVELFDEHGVSFVSVTQSFNTTSSMGRLTLNVLLSFAQFEREVTGERIRDKIAASKRKGLWMGGQVPLGYRAQDRSLAVVTDHAEVIRSLFRRYLELGSVVRLKATLDARNETSPIRLNGKGRESGGCLFSRGHLYKILSNPVYIGQIVHKGQAHPGQHESIIPQELWQQVQTRLAQQAIRRTASRSSSEALLTGKLFDEAGHVMSPSWTSKGARRWRYYVAQAASQQQHDQNDTLRRVSAPVIENTVTQAVAALAPDGRLDAAAIRALLHRVTVEPSSLVIETSVTDEAGNPRTIRVPWLARPPKPMSDILFSERDDDSTIRPMRVEAHGRLVQALGKAHHWLDELQKGRVADTQTLAEREGCSERSIRLTLSLAFVAPDIIQTALDRKLPRGFGLSRLTGLPMDWAEQRRVLGLEVTDRHNGNSV